METIAVRSEERDQFIDITDRVRRAAEAAGLTDGALLLYVPHTTAGITVNEGADPSVARDLQADLARLVPREQPDYRHREGNSSSHTRASLVGSNQGVMVEGGRLVLGTWQAIFFCEFDGPRQRKVYLKALPA